MRAVDGLDGAAVSADGHPYGRAGSKARAVERLTREQLVRLHAERFAPGELTAVVVGDVEATPFDATTRVFGLWAATPTDSLPHRLLPPPRRRDAVES